MASSIIEFFGYASHDDSVAAQRARGQKECPFLGKQCTKTLSDGEISGVCTLKPITTGPVICCPVRLYANKYGILHDIVRIAFTRDLPVLPASDITDQTGERIAVFGKGWGKELRLPARGKTGGYFVDWVLAHVNAIGELVDFVAAEVQSIDTTGNYRAEREAYLKRQLFTGRTTAGFNWENVNKRILPQIIYKGHVLRREPLCQRGLFFVCPTPVFKKITERLGGDLLSYPIQPGTVTIMWYDLGPLAEPGRPRDLVGTQRMADHYRHDESRFLAPIMSSR